MYKVIDEDNKINEIKPYEFYFNSLKEVYDFLRTQIHKEYQFRLVESGINKWGVERALILKILPPNWYNSNFWTVEKVEDNATISR